MSSEKNLKDKEKKPKVRKRPGNLFYDFVKITGALPILLWMRPKRYYVEGAKVPLRGGVLISANHGSPTDPITVQFVSFLRRVNCLATKELFKSRIGDWFFHHVHCIKVDRDNFSFQMFNEVVDRLRLGKAVVIFPEGRLNSDETLLAFKSGVILMAFRGDAPIIPVYIAKRTAWYQRQRIVIGAPIDIKTLIDGIPTADKVNAASEAVRQAEIRLKEYYESLPVAKRIRARAERKKK